MPYEMRNNISIPFVISQSIINSVAFVFYDENEIMFFVLYLFKLWESI